MGLRMPGRSLAASSPTSEDFTGHELDDATGLHYAGARYYMSALGRWTTTDPILRAKPGQLLADGKTMALSASPYNYSLNNPVNLVDRNGEWPTPWDLADFGFAAQSVSTAWGNPSWSNVGWATFDVMAAAAPVVPSSGYFRGGAKLASMVGDVGATGARRLKQWDFEKAEKAYDAIRASVDDISAIAKSTGLPEGQIRQVKEHIFFKQHQLDDGFRRFDADPAIANAWERLRSGDIAKKDIQLLEHELFETKFEGIFKTSYREAHEAANRAGRTSGLEW